MGAVRPLVVAVLVAAAALAVVPLNAGARPTLLKPFAKPITDLLRPIDRGLLDLDRDRGGTLEELLLESCDPLTRKDTDGGGKRDGQELDDGTDCLDPTDDVAAPTDKDRDGSPVPEDCNDNDPAIRPGIADPPDPNATDANCDGFDGDPGTGIFVTPTGDDANPGTREAPKRTVQAAIDAAFAQGKDVFLDSAIFDDDNPDGVTLAEGVGLFGGYRANNDSDAELEWDRRDLPSATRIEGSPQAATAIGVGGIEIQLLELRGTPDNTRSSYGARLLNGANVTFTRARVRGTDGVSGVDGANGTNGRVGKNGDAGGTGDEDGPAGAGGAPGDEFGFDGGRGGDGGDGENADGQVAARGKVGSPGSGPAGGAGGAFGPTGGCNGDDGGDGGDGGDGVNGLGGAGAGNALTNAGALWSSQGAQFGFDGTGGSGGGGGGGGGGQDDEGIGNVCDEGGGSGGGGGGAGGEAGTAGSPGQFGGGSFGLYLVDSFATVRDGSVIIGGSGGNGGRGGDGGVGGTGGEGGPGGPVTDGGLLQDVDGETGVGGDGGDGGNGGNGGAGGGGAGGPSAAIFRKGSATATVTASTLIHGTGGNGGGSDAGGTSVGANGQSGDVLQTP